ncbi:MAG TPA: tetratricopeptide repeat protein, partial [Anaerolineales bacterium]|nr:tetratricopeptide repeat protein [Anaerolineales bacterium]
MAKVSLRVYNQEIEAMIDRGQLDEAVAHCKHILKTFPKHLETYRLLGKAYLEYKRYPDAVDIFSRVLVAVPNDFVANVGMSIIRDEENKVDEAIWHMERAFETQPSNAAIQSELQRLYGRREGVQPPRIRMTRGALAQMYVQGELYPQAISEIKGVLKDDPGRTDMQVLLARAYYKSGLKNDAAEVASAVLRSNPYCLDANRVLVEILGADHPEGVQTYRQRVVELDPYAAQVTSSVFLSDEVPNMAVTLERLDWNGQPVGMQADWEATQAIALESSEHPDEKPDWLKGAFGETPSPLAGQPMATDQTPAGPAPAFDMPTAPAQPAESSDEIPDFLRAAGWGQSTGAFDESKSAFAGDEPASAVQPIEQGDLPDWVKAMAPPAPAETPAADEELPDWINKIGTSALPISSPASPSSDQPDWAKQLEQPAAAEPPTEDQPDWLKQFGASEQPASASEDQPDWLKSFASETESIPSATPSGGLDWLSQLSEESKTVEASSNESDFLKELTSQPEAASAMPSTDEFDFLNELTKDTEQLAPAATPETPATDSLGMSSAEQDDSFAWLENLAAKQGATEGLLTQPEERLQEEPDWVKQVKGADVVQPPAAQSPVAPPAGNAEELGKSEQERDDSFAWLESLAAKQGATEGLLTKPEERLDKEPEWVQQAKSVGEQPREITPEQPPQEEKPPVTEPAAKLEELGKTEQERDDSFAWLENLAAKQGATEGLLTKPEERLQEEPDWVKQAKDVQAQQPPVEQPASIGDTAAWLRSLDQEETVPEAKAPSFDDTTAWLKNLDEPEQAAPQPAGATPADELPAWMQNLEEPEPQAPAAESTIPVALPEEFEEKQPVAQEAPKPQTGGLPGWLSDLDKEETQQPAIASDESLPPWLRDETGEVVAEPTKIEPTRATDWHPVEVKQPEPAPSAPEPVVPPPPAPVEAAKEAPKPPVKPVKEPPVRRVPEPSTSLDPILGQARNELARSNIPGALENYGKLIKKARFLEDVIHDLREALYRYPVEVSIWQSLGDAYMRANRLQDALD